MILDFTKLFDGSQSNACLLLNIAKKASTGPIFKPIPRKLHRRAVYGGCSIGIQVQASNVEKKFCTSEMHKTQIPHCEIST
ncbi:hypothetical protein CEXT_628071 [Caerostris extrusa]|uniref:Uncharacterized protein n=1 Tax=Caerostris extrusa TaxID=172846 RepID=A0AAV4UPT2_CAEEX|nr:hypothetical protein CEXT_628071 [Caerostris extrusa]